MLHIIVMFEKYDFLVIKHKHSDDQDQSHKREAGRIAAYRIIPLFVSLVAQS